MLNAELSKALNEKDVENIYRAELIQGFSDSSITSPHHVDGLLQTKEGHNVLLEFKFNQTFKNKLSQCNVLVQALYYLKKFESQGATLPSAVLVGDNNECFVVPSNAITKYLSHKLDWSIPASDAHRRNPQLIQQMMIDTDIDPFVFDVDSNFKTKNLIEKIQNIASNSDYKVKVTSQNIQSIFEYFQTNVLPKNSGLSTNQEANMFVQLVINPNENYVHPKKKNILLTKNFGEVKINGTAFSSFFKHYEGDSYSPREKEKLTGFVDRLVEDSTRRRKGEFFTPTAFVDKSQEYITAALGPDWRDEYVVWDCAWGTGNLTRDYQFKELYCSTLEQADIDTANQAGYNPNAIKFQYDFLNDDDSKLPTGLKTALGDPNKKILFYINPPYMKATPKKGTDNTGVAGTLIGKEMNDAKYGIASSQLSSQFLYKVAKLKANNKNITLAWFNNPNYMTSDGFSALRAYTLSRFGFMSGFIFNAAHFSDTSDAWGISFSVWSSTPNTIKTSFPHDIVELDKGFFIKKSGVKNLYNCDNTTKANVIFDIKQKNDVVVPPMKSALNIDPHKQKMGHSAAIGYINNDSNNLNQQNVVFLASSVIAANGNKAILEKNLENVLSLFAARKIVAADWVNQKDEYLAPNEQHPNYQQFVYDSVVYSLFNNSSQQSSMRQITYKGKKHDIKNEFFWLSKEKMLELAEEHGYDELYRDAKNSGNNRYIHNMLFVKSNSVLQTNDVYNKLSSDAKLVIDMATSLVEKSIRIRQLVSQQHPEYHLDAWDAGYAQLKLIWKEYFKDDFKAFRDAYKALEDRMRPLVYTLGFLK